MASLYEIGGNYAALLDAWDAAESEDEREDILARLDAAEEDLGTKAEAYAKIMRMKEEEAKAFKSEIDRMMARKRSAENMVQRLKENLLGVMQMTGATEIHTTIGKWKVQMNPWSCEVMDIDAVPMAYHIKQEDKIDKKGLIDHFKKTGELVDGVEFKQEQGVRFR